jgi:hypothetical protein
MHKSLIWIILLMQDISSSAMKNYLSIIRSANQLSANVYRDRLEGGRKKGSIMGS